MNIVLVPPKQFLLYLVCAGCNRRLVLSKAEPDVYADLDGDAYKAYYCPPCMMKLTHPQEST
jgi:hypothetical protein